MSTRGEIEPKTVPGKPEPAISERTVETEPRVSAMMRGVATFAAGNLSSNWRRDDVDLKP